MPHIQKFQKIWLELQPYKYHARQELQDWRLRTCEYVSPGVYRHMHDAGTVSPGCHWGKTGQTGFFSRTIEVPESYGGYPLYLEIITGGEGQVFIDDQPYQGNDPNHYRVLLAPQTTGGETYHVTVESFVRRSHNEIGESRFDAATTGVFTRAELCPVDLLAQEFLFDIQYVLEYWQTHPEFAAVGSRLLTHVFSAFDIADRKSFLAYAAQGRQFLDEELTQIGRKQDEFTVWMIGQSHLDLAWFWRKNESYRKVVRTFTSVLRNMEQVDEYRFMMPQVNVFKLLETAAPAVFSQVKAKIEERKIEIGGLLFVEPDTNLVNGEWLVRHILAGRKYCQETFGITPSVESLIDAFGYSGNLPQILKKSGIKAVMVTKMRWYNDTNGFPYSAFNWQGIDGSRVLAATMPGFNYQCNPQSIQYALQSNLQPDVLKDIPVFFGWGDGGGGADDNHLQGLIRSMRWDKSARVTISGFAEYFSQLETYQPHLPTWWGEIYQEGHRGCYTSQARSKQLNRQSEALYRAVEFLTGFNQIWGTPCRYDEYQENIELILINQFHDILPGSAIHEVYLDSYQDYDRILAQGKAIRDDHLAHLHKHIDTSGSGQPIIVWNLNQVSLPAVVRVPWENPCCGVVLNSKEEAHPCIFQNGHLVFQAHDLPSMGYEVFRFIDNNANPAWTELDQPELCLENAKYRVNFNATGQITRLYDKSQQRELLAQGMPGNCLKLYFDYPKSNAAWDIDIDYKETSTELKGELVGHPQQDALKQWATFRYEFGRSTVEQDVILWKDTHRLDFETRVQWHEKHRLLRAEFALDINTAKAIYDIPFGAIERDTRPNNSYQKAQFEVPALSLVDVSEGNYGIALISEHKNGFSVEDKLVGISLLRAPAFPDTEADQGEHNFHYSLVGHTGDFREGCVIHHARNLVNPVLSARETSHPGNLPRKFSFLSVDRENVIIEALKGAEDGDGLILRLYETYGQQDVCTLLLNFELKSVIECNLVEESVSAALPVQGRQVTFRIRPYEIKTFRLQFA